MTEYDPSKDDPIIDKPKIVSPLTKPKPWLVNHPYFERYKKEACALAYYIHDRNVKQPRYKNKFTIATVDKKMIKNNNLLDSKIFRELVKKMEIEAVVAKTSSTSFKLTQKGQIWLTEVQLDNFEYEFET